MKKISIIAFIFILAFFTAASYAQRQEGPSKISPKKIEVDSNHDGKPDRIEFYDENGQITRVELDTNNDVLIDEWITYKKGRPVKSEKDTNMDGKPDVSVEY